MEPPSFFAVVEAVKFHPDDFVPGACGLSLADCNQAVLWDWHSKIVFFFWKLRHKVYSCISEPQHFGTEAEAKAAHGFYSSSPPLRTGVLLNVISTVLICLKLTRFD